MAVINSLTYLVYSMLTLAANNRPAVESSLKSWEGNSESHVTETWNQPPHFVTGKYSEGDCPAGETWSDCDAGCQSTCENVGQPVICPRMCIPGCVCEEPGAVRGHDRKCINPPLCPPSYDPTVEPLAERDPEYSSFRVTRDPTGQPLAERDPEYSSFRVTRHPTGQPLAERDPEYSSLRVTRHPDESDRAEQNPDISRVDPDESIRAEQHPDFPTGELYTGGCPDVGACKGFCKRRKYMSGICVGSNKKICQCWIG